MNYRLLKQFKQVKGLRGKGYLIGIEVEGQAVDYVHRAREEHQLLILVAGPKVIRLLPPLTTTKSEIDQFINTIKTIFAD